jgi:hypothetical protein
VNKTERCRVAAIFFFAFVFLAESVAGQGTQAATQNPLGPFAHSIERRLAEQDLRALPLKLRERRERNLADPKILEQMNEDFLRIQTIRAEMVSTFSRGGLIEPDILKDLAVETKRRSSRLRSMLALAEDSDTNGPKAKIPTTVEALNDQAYKLCIEISRFTENPIFKSKGVLTARHAGEADETLGVIASLAESIQKASSSLSKK